MYEWRCSALNTSSNLYSLPSLEDTGRFIVPSATDEISIYPVPLGLNCSGTVLALGYCYRVDSNQLETRNLIFTLLTLVQNELSLMVTDIIPVYSTPTDQTCDPVLLPYAFNHYCCDFLLLNTVNQFSLPAPNFAFGIVISEISLLAFHPLLSIRVEHHRLSESGLPAVGDTISVDNTTTDRSLRLFQFFISKDF